MGNIKNKQIIILIGIIFLAFVGYKIISSNIQENKEKAVLQEKARLQELEKEPLNKCIEKIEKKAEDDILFLRSTNNEMYTQKFQYDCQNLDGHMGSVFRKNTVDYCKPYSLERLNIENEKIRDEAKIKIRECYKRYK